MPSGNFFYMDIRLLSDRILINNPDTFKAKDTLECGQVFRFNALESGYELISKDKKCNIIEHGNLTEIITDYPDYFYKYFDLDTDYNDIINTINSRYGLKSATSFGRGIRILNQSPFETLISFIISANNNIKRIRGIIDRICSGLGEDKGGYYAFPTIDKMANSCPEFFVRAGAGYRADYIIKTAQAICQGFDLNELYLTDTGDARERLMRLTGVGRKVADCILLFAYGKTDVFPVDIWIKKIYNHYYNNEDNPDKMSKKLIEIFGGYSGYIQQYLYYYIRENKGLLESCFSPQ